MIQDRKANHNKQPEANYRELEEVLRKSSSTDLESEITIASEAIGNHEMEIHAHPFMCNATGSDDSLQCM